MIDTKIIQFVFQNFVKFHFRTKSLMKVLSEKDIDTNRTVSNDICEIFEILGLGSLLFDLLDSHAGRWSL